ncbi:MAG TPA: PhzF family phenazine biosynthesis protein [Flexivirga sp.]|uniref:PhzF family phenazine biosynthesis protein n=1 Tax=Flexivirga sp. TaxID=1962927 RepID=UPI002B62BC76|nr:PhzF family phenazine biosynthesis protein [Flexivirga sp.]HWC22960.1 PhzF family phenazine biosynthesis protein [Flexivirga sp.]
MTKLHVLKVFVGEDGRGGNPLGVFLDAGAWDAEKRQRIATELGFSETVFVQDADRAEVRIHTPAVELPLAGHPLVGTSWLLRREGLDVPVLRPAAGEVPTWVDGDDTWISARPEWAPEFDMRQLPSPADVDAHPGAGPDEHLHVWSWEDESAGAVRVRVFPTRMGIAEDEATGAAAIRFGALVQRPVTIHQGVASRIVVQPGDDGTVAIGGQVEYVESREHFDA